MGVPGTWVGLFVGNNEVNSGFGDGPRIKYFLVLGASTHTLIIVLHYETMIVTIVSMWRIWCQG